MKVALNHLSLVTQSHRLQALDQAGTLIVCEGIKLIFYDAPSPELNSYLVTYPLTLQLIPDPIQTGGKLDGITDVEHTSGELA